ncbi:MAG: T4 RnlA family RNA ligase [Candidatus Pacearchaeota archaeon]
MKINLTELTQAMNDGLVFLRRHPDYPDLAVLKYTPACQYSRDKWTPFIKLCRGLVVNTTTGEVLSRGFEKFFNYDELSSVGETVPDLPYEIYDKVDGSLIIYGFDMSTGMGIVNSVGSFESDQAEKAKQLLGSKYQQNLIKIACFSLSNRPKAYSWVFEVIYPENQIVVNYGNREELVLLAVKEVDSGDELPYEELAQFGFPVVKRFDHSNIEDLISTSKTPAENSEGFVIKFSNNYRVKIKFDEYVHLHRIMTNLSEKDIFEMVRTHQDFNSVLQNVPDELFDSIKAQETKYLEQVEQTREQAQTEFANLKLSLGENHTRKDFALAAIKSDYKGLLFLLLDNKDIEEAVWDKVYRMNFE